MMNPSERLVVEGSCSKCQESDQISYRWTLYEKNNVQRDWLEVPDLPAKTTTGTDARNLVFRRDVLQGGRRYKLVFKAWKMGRYL